MVVWENTLTVGAEWFVPVLDLSHQCYEVLAVESF